MKSFEFLVKPETISPKPETRNPKSEKGEFCSCGSYRLVMGRFHFVMGRFAAGHGPFPFPEANRTGSDMIGSCKTTILGERVSCPFKILTGEPPVVPVKGKRSSEYGRFCKCPMI